MATCRSHVFVDGDEITGVIDLDVIRAWWSLRSLRAIRWLVEHGFGPWPEVAVLNSRLCGRISPASPVEKIRCGH